jgi:WD40 repeat protein
MDIIDVPRINGMLTSSLDKHLIIWDLKTFEVRFTMQLTNSFSVHTLKYSSSHDLLFTASYETCVKIWHFDSAIECSLVNTLAGHESMVTAIEII